MVGIGIQPAVVLRSRLKPYLKYRGLENGIVKTRNHHAALSKTGTPDRRLTEPSRRAAVAILSVHLFVVSYEEPTLRKKFGAEYEEYCRNVRRWWPRVRGWQGFTDS